MCLKRHHQWMIFIFFLSIGIILSSAHAKMSPLKPVNDMLVRPNILFIFDTSGSMQRTVDGGDITWSKRDSENRMAGDHPDSRLYIAKDVVINVLNDSRTLANFGLMSFKQTHYGWTSSSKGYFPYQRTSSTITVKVKYFSRYDLDRRIYTVGGVPYQKASSGWPDYEPVQSFWYRGTKYMLKHTDNSLYQRRLSWRRSREVKHNYCGYRCVFTDPTYGGNYTWQYRGSYYEYEEQQTTSTKVYFRNYYGKQFTADGTEDDAGGASATVNPGDTFLYYPGGEGWDGVPRDFYYALTASWTTTSWPVGAADYKMSSYGGMLLVPFSFSEVQGDQDAVVDDILRWMQPQNDAGLIATGYTPTGSTLDGRAYTYFNNTVNPTDPITCRKNYIIFITDGEPTPSTEISKAKTAAAKVYNDLNVRVYMIGFGSDTAGSNTLDAIARNGGCPLKPDGHYAYYAADAEELTDAVKKIIYEAAIGDYATSAPSSGSQQGSIMSKNIGLLATCEFPSWKGHLNAIDLSTGTKLWDAGEQLDANHIAYDARKIYTSDASRNLVPFFSGGSPNAATLFAMGLGSGVQEAQAIIEFIAGKDQSWRLYDITNCTPISIGRPYMPADASYLPGHDVFEGNYAYRNTVVYTGGNDCMLHCFCMSTGQELFAYVPPDLLPKLKDLYVNGGQPSDPAEHIYGIAASPKAFDVDLDKAGDWRTVVVCGEGLGGYHYFALDVTHPSPGDYNNDPAQPPFSVLWHSGDNHIHGFYDAKLGQSWSTPALGTVFYKDAWWLSAADKRDFVALMGSGYDDPNSGDVEGTHFMIAKFNDNPDENGSLVTSFDLGSPATIVDHGLVADAVALEEQGIIVDAFVADTAGRVWCADVDGKVSNWSMSVLYNATLNQPFFYSPAALRVGTGASACSVLAAVSGTYDDPAINDPNTSFESKLYLFELDSGENLNDYEVIRFTDILMDANTGQNFPQRARPVSSPIILQNETSSQYEAIFLVYVPPTDMGCDPGRSYLVVFKLGAFGSCGLNPERIVTLDAGVGKVTGIDLVGDPSAVLVGVSGYGTGSQSTMQTVPSTSSFVSGTVKQLYWKEHMN